MKNHILIVGGTGIVGRAAINHFENLSDWNVTTLSRRAMVGRPSTRHLTVDLLDGEAVNGALKGRPDITRVLYTAVYEEARLATGWNSARQIATNALMLQNLLDALAHSCHLLRHVTLLQGGKAYGSHLGPVAVPAKERWPRIPHEVFYWPQEDLLRERQASASWTFSILRPQLILGQAIGSPMNLVAAIGVYASILRELGLPLTFPGGEPFVTAATDSRLIARAVEFVGTSPGVASGETFNVVNGDVLVWNEVIWPAVARHFRMPLGEPVPASLERTMPTYKDTWARIVKEHELVELSMDEIVGSSWQYADFAFAVDRQAAHWVMSPIKLRQVGFTDCHDTEDSVIYWLSAMQESRYLPR